MDLYEQPHDPKRPVICFDERPCQLIDDVIAPIPMKPGSLKKEHYEYSRNGTCCIFMACVKEHRTKVDWANFTKELAQHYPDAGPRMSSRPPGPARALAWGAGGLGSWEPMKA